MQIFNNSHIRHLSLALASATFVGILIGCGGGGAGLATTGSTTGSTNGGNAQTGVTGVISMPSDQVNAAGGRGGRDTLVPIEGASVELRKLSDDALADTATTDADGVYVFDNFDPSADYTIIAKKNFGTKELKVKAVISLGADAATTKKTVDVNPVTTVAGQAAINKYVALKALDSNFDGNIEDIADELEVGGANGTAPDLSSDDAINQAASDLTNAQAAEGSYIGSFKGTNQGRIAVRIKDGYFMVAKLPGEGFNEESFSRESAVLVGTVDENGLIEVFTEDGLTIRGTLVGKTGVGTWSSENGEHGIWGIKQVTQTSSAYAGFYGGVFEGEAPGDGGHFGVIVAPNGEAVLEATTADGSLTLFGVGRVNSNGEGHIKYQTSAETRGTLTFTVTNGTISGAVISEDQEFPFSLTKDFDPTLFITG